jgi:hypothetical protein
MFTVWYEEWTYDVTCGGDYADVDVSTAYVADTDMAAGDDSSDTDTCAYDVYVYYDDGTDANGDSIDATSQTFTVYFDNSVATAASALVLAGVAAMYF